MYQNLESTRRLSKGDPSFWPEIVSLKICFSGQLAEASFVYGFSEDLGAAPQTHQLGRLSASPRISNETNPNCNREKVGVHEVPVGKDGARGHPTWCG
jgi:hypothetical protein